MARIPDEEIARIKRETDLVALVRSRGVELVKARHEGLVGPLFMVSESEVFDTDITTDQACRLIMSGGLVKRDEKFHTVREDSV